jgi:hypothetical protein
VRVTSADPRDAPARKRPAGGELIIPALAVLFTAYYFVTVRELDWEAKANGIVIGAILLLLVALLLVRIVLAVARGRASLALGFGGLTHPNRTRLALLAISALFLAALPWLGTSIALALMLFASMWVLGARHWPSLVGVALVLPLFVWASLMVGIGTRLPQGPFEQAMHALTGLGIAD